MLQLFDKKTFSCMMTADVMDESGLSSEKVLSSPAKPNAFLFLLFAHVLLVSYVVHEWVYFHIRLLRLTAKMETRRLCGDKFYRDMLWNYLEALHL